MRQLFFVPLIVCACGAGSSATDGSGAPATTAAACVRSEGEIPEAVGERSFGRGLVNRTAPGPFGDFYAVGLEFPDDEPNGEVTLWKLAPGGETLWKARWGNELGWADVWELGSGGAAGYAYAWFIALFGLLTGLLGAPRATWRAFVAGRSMRNLYGDAEPMRRLAHPVDDVRRELTVDTNSTSPRDAALPFVGWSALASTLGVLFVLGSPVLVFAAFVRRWATSGFCRCACSARHWGTAT